MTVRTASTAGNAPPTAPRWVTMFGPVARRLLKAGVPLGFNGLVTVRGRKTGVPRTTPIAIISVGGRRWIWAPWGGSQWVGNLRAARRATIAIRGREEEVRAVELDRAQRAAWFGDTLRPLAQSFPLGMWFIRTVDRTDLDDPVAAAEGRAVFELLPLA